MAEGNRESVYEEMLSDKKLQELAEEMTTEDGRLFGLNAGFSSAKIDNILAEKRSTADQNLTLLTRWRNKEGSCTEAVFEKLMSCLIKIGRKDLVDDTRKRLRERQQPVEDDQHELPGQGAQAAARLIAGHRGPMNIGVMGDVKAPVGSIVVGSNVCSKDQPGAVRSTDAKGTSLLLGLDELLALGRKKPDPKFDQPSSMPFGKKAHNALSVGHLRAVLKDAPEAVGALMKDDVFLGTGFRVGTKYIMTCWHVVRRDEKSDEMSSGLRIVFNFLSSTPQLDCKIMKLEYHHKDYDVAVLQIDQTGQIPECLKLMKEPVHGPVCFIGHPVIKNSSQQCLDPVVEVVRPDSLSDSKVAEVNAYWTELKKKCDENPDKAYDNSDKLEVHFRGIDDDGFCILHTAFLPGASGSPGLVKVDGDNVKVGTMLCRGFPRYYFELTDFGRSLHPLPSEKYRFEHGLDMSMLYNVMTKRAYVDVEVQLIADIFD